MSPWVKVDPPSGEVSHVGAQCSHIPAAWRTLLGLALESACLRGLLAALSWGPATCERAPGQPTDGD